MLYSKGPSQADPIFPLRPWSSIVEGVDVTSLDRFERACVQAGNPYGTHCTKPSSPSVGVPWYMAQCLTILS